MKTSLLIRFACIVALWLLLCYIVLASQPFNLRVLFVIVASGIVVFVPIYKKYQKNGKARSQKDA